MGNASYYSVEKRFSSSLLSKKLKNLGHYQKKEQYQTVTELYHPDLMAVVMAHIIIHVLTALHLLFTDRRLLPLKLNIARRLRRETEATTNNKVRARLFPSTILISEQLRDYRAITVSLERNRGQQSTPPTLPSFGGVKGLYACFRNRQGMSSHNLILKVGAIVMLIRNTNMGSGLVNGIRMKRLNEMKVIMLVKCVRVQHRKLPSIYSYWVEGKLQKKPQPDNLSRPGIEPGPSVFADRANRYSTGVDEFIVVE
ncbi:hypothetical protein ANN_10632 [Periplaneta americana]|uniref:DNA helicase Pif1-like 2B domain-containing protein n=1 Tax=Periplaneta americana TaxID=6978 RepID=A0ABQ8T2S9_PERAM|nr:hypothetical protein ANN_10632 [Periplaneta americana]